MTLIMSFFWIGLYLGEPVWTHNVLTIIYMKKRGLFILILICFILIAGCGTYNISEEKGMLSYSIKGCMNKQVSIAKRAFAEEPLKIETTK